MNLKRILTLVLALCLVLGLCACGGTGDDAQPSETSGSSENADTPTGGETQAQDQTEPADDGKVTYTVTVVDASGSPISGAIVQLCLDACTPCDATDANGVTSKAMPEADYKVSFIIVPAGYTAEEAYYFDAGSHELTITLQAAE